jgi:DNA repair protein RadC
MIKDMPLEERPRERLAKHGVAALSNEELVAILFRTGSAKRSVMDVAKSLVYSLSEMGELGDKTLAELADLHGVGIAKACTIIAALELGKRVLAAPASKTRIATAFDAFTLLKNDLVGLKQETLIALYLDVKNNLIAKKTIFIGGLNQSLVHPREVFKYAVKYSAYQIVLAHNHPSGDPRPSMEDLEVTKQLVKIGEMMQIKIADHLVITADDYVSILSYQKK